ncbi:FAD:protein FMN transferase [Sneathiella sp. HT1-7]|jgi:thiamine biosynthesis lipoprotein|uniref:FAD:protein FMN transferase n=1 Tax=Sneathiella sp. HT1-7 TaxID=2887192 RepID=UPI001D154A71|nr:FAD:protein FMN transferase [Sneathiella sp. HT1-7]MCC3306402.1 FAD:protein FMN transferase [Sneathiella sp. HT1-7]
MTKIPPIPKITRRRFIITASAAGAFASQPVSAATLAGGLQQVNWKGAALGAEASIQLFHRDPQWAREQLQRCQKEIYRLEELFSLYRPDSTICRLNADGYLDNPDIEFLNLLSLSKSFSEQTKGFFDVTIQPLWKLYADHFSENNADPFGPSPSAISAALEKVGSSKIELSASRITFKRPEMAITLNGIAQGYITDRVSDLLKSAGFEDVLVSLGENFALGRKSDGSPWRVGILSPADGKTISSTVNLTNKALATSGGYGSPFSEISKANHLLNPQTGEWSELNRSVSVISSSATHADAASTALALMTSEERADFIERQPLIEEVIYG